jgi:hypothetical protein
MRKNTLQMKASLFKVGIVYISSISSSVLMMVHVSLRGQPLAILDRNAGYTGLNSASEAIIKSIAPSPPKKGLEIRGWRLRQKIF